MFETRLIILKALYLLKQDNPDKFFFFEELQQKIPQLTGSYLADLESLGFIDKTDIYAPNRMDSKKGYQLSLAGEEYVRNIRGQKLVFFFTVLAGICALASLIVGLTTIALSLR